MLHKIVPTAAVSNLCKKRQRNLQTASDCYISLIYFFQDAKPNDSEETDVVKLRSKVKRQSDELLAWQKAYSIQV